MALAINARIRRSALPPGLLNRALMASQGFHVTQTGHKTARSCFSEHCPRRTGVRVRQLWCNVVAVVSAAAACMSSTHCHRFCGLPRSASKSLTALFFLQVLTIFVDVPSELSTCHQTIFVSGRRNCLAFEPMNKLPSPMFNAVETPNFGMSCGSSSPKPKSTELKCRASLLLKLISPP